MSTTISTRAPLLIIEKEPALRDLMALRLKHLGKLILTASNAADATQKAIEYHPDLIILDLLLPQISGVELLHQFRELTILDHAKVIIITSLGYPEVLEKAMQAGANDFLVKPFNVDDLFLRAQHILAHI